MHIGYDIKNGVEYGKICCSHWIDGKDKKTYTNLGRVIDKQKHIFKNRKRGLFQFDVLTGEYHSLDEDEYSSSGSSSRHALILNFGDAWFIDKYLHESGLYECILNIPCNNQDTVLSLLQFYMLNELGLYRAKDWFKHSFASVLYPQASLSSQRISEQLEQIGSEEAVSSFFFAYIGYMKNAGEDIQNILIDSTWLPNSIHFPLTGVSNHNGKISNEIRLIYVTQEKTGIPVFFRYVQGTIPDVTTLASTVKELSQNGVSVSEVLLDVGYYSEKNVIELYKAGIHFVCRMKENLRLYKELAAHYRTALEAEENLVKFGKRLVFIVKKSVSLAPGCPGYAYVCLDISRRAIETERLLDRMDLKEALPEDLFSSLESEGIFVIASSKDLSKEDILPVTIQDSRLSRPLM